MAHCPMPVRKRSPRPAPENMRRTHYCRMVVSFRVAPATSGGESMRFNATSLVSVVLLTFGAGLAQARQWPPGPGTCTDTTVIDSIQRGTTCKPGQLDTVLSVKGIVTALKVSGTSRSFYMMNQHTDLPWQGIDC